MCTLDDIKRKDLGYAMVEGWSPRFFATSYLNYTVANGMKSTNSRFTRFLFSLRKRIHNFYEKILDLRLLSSS